MAFDGMFLHKICEEIKDICVGSRIDKIYQPSREEIVLLMRAKGENKRLLISCSPNNPRIHFTSESIENPLSPPMFCMLMRKHIGNAKLVDIIQPSLERIAQFKFESLNEFGDTVVLTLAVEIMGRYSNIILINENGKIIDSIRRVDDTVSSVRRVLPGLSYSLPLSQNKLSLKDENVKTAVEKILSQNELPLSKAALNTLEGTSPLLCRELSFYVSKSLDTAVNLLTEDQIDRLTFFLTRLKDSLNSPPTAVMLSDSNSKPVEYSFFPINQYGHTLVSTEFESLSALLDTFFKTKSITQRMGQKSHDLLKLLVNLTERIERKLLAQRKELEDCANREKYREYGDIISANLFKIEKGMSKIVLENFYSENLENVEIKLDPMLSPTQNAQKYYSEYRKLDTAEKMLTKLISQGEKEKEYLESVFDSLSRAESESELSMIKQELIESGYLKKNKGYKPQKSEKVSYMRYISTDGFLILSGRNNIQNDKLTLKDSSKNDVWFHTHNIPGSHTVVVSENKVVPNSTLTQAAMIAAFNSKARTSSLVPVDYTEIKNIKKPSGGKPGMVIYSTYQTAYVTPNEQEVNALLEK